MIGAVLAALWMLGLWAAAPLLRGGPRVADRLRDALTIGVAIPFVLAFLHLFYAPFCWLVLAACIAGAVIRRRRERGFREPVPFVLLAALALIAWPAIVRPPLDGDTLSYHLPNAALWAHTHSLWVTQTRYWWYPPGSELFASALYLVSTPFAVGWAGLSAIALLGFRLYAWAREGAMVPVRLADALAAATVCILPLALQAGTLQNDVWLAAFFIEILWSAPVDEAAAMRTAALCTLVKPDGWIFALVALLCSGARPRAWIAACVVFALWIVHDVALAQGAFISPASTAFAHVLRSTMIAHPLATLSAGLGAMVRDTPLGLLLVLVALASPRLARGTPLAFAGIAAVAVALVMPFGFADTHAQLATGASLRYFAPAMAAGALILAPYTGRLAKLSLALLLLAVLGEWLRLLGIFRSDLPAMVGVVAAIIVPIIVAYARRAGARSLLAGATGVAIFCTALVASRHTVDFYTDALTVYGHRTGVYAWIARKRPPRIAGWGLWGGTVAVLSPQTLAVDVPDEHACSHARAAAAILVAVAETTRSVEANAARLTAARQCGKLLYLDGFAVAVRP